MFIEIFLLREIPTSYPAKGLPSVTPVEDAVAEVPVTVEDADDDPATVEVGTEDAGLKIPRIGASYRRAKVVIHMHCE